MENVRDTEDHTVGYLVVCIFRDVDRRMWAGTLEHTNST